MLRNIYIYINIGLALRKSLNALPAVVASLLLASCNGSSSSDQPVVQVQGELTPASSATARAGAARFIQMASLAATPNDIDSFLKLGAEAWLDSELAIQNSTSRFDWMLDNGYGEVSAGQTLQGLNSAIWERAINANNPVLQKWVLALSEIFVINAMETPALGGKRGFGGAAYLDMLETHGLGTFRNLLEEVTLSSQMGRYLSLHNSRKTDASGRAPDENYAREVLQLFSIGLYELNIDGSLKLDAFGNLIETYDNDDVLQLAKALTGWKYVSEARDDPSWHQQKMVQISQYHDTSEQRFLNTTIAAGTSGERALQIALDAIADHPNNGPFIGGQLIKKLVTSNPSPSYIERVARVFNNDGNGVRGNLKAILKAILLDPEALGSSPFGDNRQGKLREPMLRFIQWGRTFDLTDPSGQWRIGPMHDPVTGLAQSPLYAPSVFNFFRPGYIPPNTDLGALGFSSPEMQITNEVTVVAYTNFVQDVIKNGIGTIKPSYAEEIALAADGRALVDHLNLILTANQLRSGPYNLIVDAVNSMSSVDELALLQRVHAAILMIMVSPDYLVLL